MKIGDLIKFRYVYSGCSLNNATAVYIGKDYIHRDDGQIIRNHKIIEVGETKPTIIDGTMLKYMEVLCK